MLRFSFLQTKDEFLGLFTLDLHSVNIPYESAEQSLLTQDYPLLKRKYEKKHLVFPSNRTKKKPCD